MTLCWDLCRNTEGGNFTKRLLSSLKGKTKTVAMETFRSPAASTSNINVIKSASIDVRVEQKLFSRQREIYSNDLAVENKKTQPVTGTFNQLRGSSLLLLEVQLSSNP
ncbi:hypothetical protein ATANTOWER_004398 [Ataeniobius toweri]|uniref:Uncharacterized protein n=1 Tax=Ataeniobius toweri TaxID=208326 RepID=A0ABU7A5K6_9TELE|nr:hypothetical protein [Ataeniobius toweri]